MKRTLSVWIVVVLAGALGAALAQNPPVPAAEEAWEDALAREVARFYEGYWRAWDGRDADGVDARLSPDYRLVTVVAGQGVAQVGKEAALQSVRQFFEAIGEREVLWQRRILSILPRDRNEAIAVVRTDFQLGPMGHSELSLEVVRRSGEGWQIVRQTLERVTFQDAGPSGR